MRNRLRTLLVLASFAAGSCLYGVLATIRESYQEGFATGGGGERLIVKSRISLYVPLPQAYAGQLAAIPGVRAVTPMSWLGGLYQSERNFFPQIAIDPRTFREVFPEYEVPDEQWRMFCQDRLGCVMGARTAERFGWKLGDRIPIIGVINPGTWEFRLRGIYHGKRQDADTTQMWLRYDYLDEGRILGRGTVGWYVVRIARPELAGTVLEAIDQRFRNSEYETETETESAISTGIIRQVGNLTAILLSAGSSGFLTILLITGSAMILSVRERAAELSILKAIGFSGARIVGIVLGECTLCAGLGGAAGIGLAKLFTLTGDPTGGLLLRFYLSPLQAAAGFSASVAAGLLSGALPALLAMRLGPAEGIRRA